MKKSIKSTYNISKRLYSDIQSKIFRFRKNVKFFKWAAAQYYFSVRQRYPLRVQFFHDLRKRFKVFKKPLAKKINYEKKFKVFYGKMNHRQYKRLFHGLKGKVSFSFFNYFFSRLEFRPYMLMFRFSQFTDTLVPLQLVKVGFVCKNGYTVKFSEIFKLSDILSMPFYFFNIREHLRRLFKSIKYLYPIGNAIVSEYLPIGLLVYYMDFLKFKKTFKNRPFLLFKFLVKNMTYSMIVSIIQRIIVLKVGYFF